MGRRSFSRGATPLEWCAERRCFSNESLGLEAAVFLLCSLRRCWLDNIVGGSDYLVLTLAVNLLGLSVGARGTLALSKTGAQ